MSYNVADLYVTVEQLGSDLSSSAIVSAAVNKWRATVPEFYEPVNTENVTFFGPMTEDMECALDGTYSLFESSDFMEHVAVVAITDDYHEHYQEHDLKIDRQTLNTVREWTTTFNDVSDVERTLINQLNDPSVVALDIVSIPEARPARTIHYEEEPVIRYKIVSIGEQHVQDNFATALEARQEAELLINQETNEFYQHLQIQPYIRDVVTDVILRVEPESSVIKVKATSHVIAADPMIKKYNVRFWYRY